MLELFSRQGNDQKNKILPASLGGRLNKKFHRVKKRISLIA